MPLYSYHCATCGRDADEFSKIADRDNGPACCDAAMGRKLSAPMVMVPGGIGLSYECPMTGEHVQSMRRRKYLMEQNNVVDSRELSDTWARKRAKDAADKAEAKQHYDSLPDAVKKAAKQATTVPPAMA